MKYFGAYSEKNNYWYTIFNQVMVLISKIILKIPMVVMEIRTKMMIVEIKCLYGWSNCNDPWNR